jgi:type IV pilus assembly protein PilM
MSAHTFFSTYFPAPKFLDMSSVGIDISPLAIRMMEITDRSSLKVGKYAEANLKTPFVITDGDQREVKDILKKWKKDYNLTYIKASLPEDKAYLFDTEIEFGTEAAMRSSIEFSLEENVPLSGPEVIFDYRLIGESTKEGFVKVAVTVLPVGVVNNYLALFHECGLTPISFVTEAQGLSRALITRGDLGTYLIVNIHHTKTSVFIISKGAVQFTSTVAIGSLDFVKALQTQFSLSQEEAEKMKETKGFTRSEGQDKDILVALINTASVFRGEIEKVYLYWNKHRVSIDPTEAIQKVILSGKEALTLGFKEYLNQTLKVPTERGNVWLNVTNFDNYIPPLPLATALNFGTAIGLALPENE